VCLSLVPRLSAVLLALPLLSGAGARSDTRVLLVEHGRVSIHARSAPLTEILTRFAQATGTEVVYEAARPRQLVSVVIEAGSPAEAIAQLLEGQGLNYALRLDPSGKNVEMLIITGSASPAAAPAGAALKPRSGPPAFRVPEEEAEADEGDQPFAAEAPEGLDRSVPPGPPPEDAISPAPGGPWPGVAPNAPPVVEPSSPAAPSGSPEPEPGQPQIPAPASYPGGAPVSPPVPSPPVYPGPASYPGGA
jgi:hypothetical protein